MELLLKLCRKLEDHYLPRWVIMIFDLIVVFFSLCITYIIYNNDLSIDARQVVLKYLLTLPFYLLTWQLIKPHIGLIRYFSIHDILRYVYANSYSTFGVLIVSFLIGLKYNTSNCVIHHSILFFNLFLSIFSLIFIRLIIKKIDNKATQKGKIVSGSLIYGAGNIGIVTKNAIEQEMRANIKIIGFIDNNPLLKNRKIAGVPVISEERAFTKVINGTLVSEIIIAEEFEVLNSEKRRQIVDECFKNNIKVREVPDVSKWLNNKLHFSQIKDINIEDLLGRTPIKLNNENIELNGKTLLITGAAGSIGSEIVRQILKFKPTKLILVDRGETALYELQNEINALAGNVAIVYAISDTTNKFSMDKLFRIHHPDIIYHAAAYKHVPLMEAHPYEAIRNNILSIKIIADLAVKYKAKKFVMISTDKAVNPTNVMGASKRICELYVQALSRHNKHETEFITTRFGNVLGSNGSVIPLFKNQIRSGGPITVTHKEIIRYFMTIPEACQLVIEASFMGKGGEIYIFDMGEPIKIFELAERMIFLSGFVPHEDIKIAEIGLRPGEKLYEELLNNKDLTMPTYNERIMIAKTTPLDFKAINFSISELIKNLSNEDDEQLVARMKAMILDYKSNNSRFEILD